MKAVVEIRQLTGLRGVCALIVVVGHYSNAGTPLLKYVTFHDVAVDIFFCLSSFTLCLVYGAGGATPLRLWPFASARIARIYPVYMATFLLSLLIQVWRDPDQVTALHVASQALLLNALPVPHLAGAWNNPAWSVSVEMVCYALIFPVAFRASRFMGRRPGFAGVLLLAMVVADYVVFHGYYAASVFTVDDDAVLAPMAYWTPLVRGFSMFVAGWLVFVLWRRSGGFAALPQHATDMVAVVCAGIVLAAPWGVTQRHAVVFMTPLLIAGLMDARSLTARALAARPVVFVGRISFSLYLVHQPVLLVYKAAPMFEGDVAAFCVPLAVALAASVALFYAVEVPMRRVVRGVLLRPSRAPGGDTGATAPSLGG